MHAQRPRVCRSYDSSSDARIWIDYEKRIPQPIDAPVEHEAGFDLVERARLRARAAGVEKKAVADSFADHGPTRAF